MFHDDQHGTAIVVTAALLNALRVVKKEIGAIRVVVNGPGAAGTAIIKMLLAAGVRGRDRLRRKRHFVQRAGRGHRGPQGDAVRHHESKAACAARWPTPVKGADVFIGVSVGGALKPEMVRTMARDAIVFAMANPVPEITPEEARAAGVRVMGTGRSDYPNQINNVLAFPGVFKGALSRARAGHQQRHEGGRSPRHRGSCQRRRTQ